MPLARSIVECPMAGTASQQGGVIHDPGDSDGDPEKMWILGEVQMCRRRFTATRTAAATWRSGRSSSRRSAHFALRSSRLAPRAASRHASLAVVTAVRLSRQVALHHAQHECSHHCGDSCPLNRRDGSDSRCAPLQIPNRFSHAIGRFLRPYGRLFVTPAATGCPSCLVCDPLRSRRLPAPRKRGYADW